MTRGPPVSEAALELYTDPKPPMLRRYAYSKDPEHFMVVVYVARDDTANMSITPEGRPYELMPRFEFGKRRENHTLQFATIEQRAASNAELLRRENARGKNAESGRQ